ncbi:MAG TPA: twin-arginine translocation pathway signal protein, partial [Candidatus Krumholzibacteria bacterium]|nr:twin-arginine translocation pathway signal protein [Candidatus Krumholzibacteria bacterium]
MKFRLIILVLATSLISTAALAADDFKDVAKQVAARHVASIQMLQEWIALPSIAAENLNSSEGAEYMAKLAKEAGFQTVTIIQTDGKPGVFATLDAKAKKTVGL